MKERLFIKADEIAKELGVSKAYAYKMLREMNKELEEKGFWVIPGRISRVYFKKKLYGIVQEEEINASL